MNLVLGCFPDISNNWLIHINVLNMHKTSMILEIVISFYMENFDFETMQSLYNLG